MQKLLSERFQFFFRDEAGLLHFIENISGNLAPFRPEADVEKVIHRSTVVSVRPGPADEREPLRSHPFCDFLTDFSFHLQTRLIFIMSMREH